ncbi:hypothetical protein FGADI_732 [Fusarium gaditjirri]|uniref:Uncharacterized protein n=1 Tax=Fusarium gaditjirri TaxID=282569 RepID=A0A8H4TN56_9HYPO|nr:hypothetical protein FGADI_732 [Fusarium gaditjirri]
MDPSNTDTWTYLFDYDSPSGFGLAGVVHEGKVVLVQSQRNSGINCITMLIEDIKNPSNWNASIAIDGTMDVHRGLSLYISRMDLSDGAKSSVRLLYSDTTKGSVCELTLDPNALNWYPSNRPWIVPSTTGVGATASPDGTRVWFNTQPAAENGSWEQVMWNFSLDKLETTFTYQTDLLDGLLAPWAMTYLYGDLIVAWLEPEIIRWTMQRPGGYFDLTSWMSTVSDELLVSEMSIPGTHASATSSDLTLFTGKHSVHRRQNMNIIQQLNAGIRFLHLIVGISDEEGSQTLSLYTPEVNFINYETSTLIKSLCTWLDGHPSEGIILFFSPASLEQNPTTLANALNALISSNSTYFVPTASTPTLALSQLRSKILIMHTLNQSGSSSTTISAGIDLGQSYPTPLNANYNQIVSLTTESGIQFTVQDYSVAAVDSASEADASIQAKSSLIASMLSTTADTGSVNSLLYPVSYPPQLPNTWFLNWMNFNTPGSGSHTSNNSLTIAKSINPAVTTWLNAQNDTSNTTVWCPRVGIVVSDFSEITDGTLISRIVSMNGLSYMQYAGGKVIPPFQ